MSTSDVGRVAHLLENSYPHRLRPYLPYAQHGVSAYLNANVKPVDEDRLFWVVEDGESVVAFAEFRGLCSTDAFLSYICVSSACRSAGIGSHIIRFFLQRHPQVTRLDLDVFEENGRAIAWYEKLGFRQTGHSTWCCRTLGHGVAGVVSSVSSLANARAELKEFGFCRFSAVVDGRNFEFGRIGARVLRCYHKGAFANPDLLAGVKHEFPQIEEALFIDHSSAPAPGSTPLVTARRMTLRQGRGDT